MSTHPPEQPDLFPETHAGPALARRGRATLAVAVVGAMTAVGGWAALSSSLGPEDRAPEFAPQDETLSIQVTNKLAPKAASGAYRQPREAEVQRAFADVSAAYADGGLARLARESSGCFSRLAGQPSYDLLDYCIAFDSYAQAIHAHASGQNRNAQSEWFDGAEARRLSAAATVLAGRADPIAHLQRIRQLTLGEAEEEPQIQKAVAEQTDPAQFPQAARATTPVAAPAPNAEAAAPAMAQEPERAEPAPIRVSRPTPMPPAIRPSFNCRYARSQSERLVCADPELAQADRRLAQAFEDAVANGADRQILRAEQDRWLRYREAAAPDPNAVAEVYEQRITELQAMAHYRYSGEP